MDAGGDRLEPLQRYTEIVPEFDQFLSACERPLPMAVRVNTLRVEPPTAVSALRDEGFSVEVVQWDPTLLVLDTDSPGNTWPYLHGWIHGQELVSALPATVLDPDPGERVLDACAAPGSKTSQLAACCHDDATLVANDASLGRVSALRSNLDRLGITSAVVTNRDGRHIDPSSLGLDTFDATLVDAPCSCEGTIRKNPDALDDWRESYLDEISQTQRGLLRRAVRVTREGGRVVYATCTFAPEENEAVLDDVLTNEACRIVPIELPVSSVPAVTEWQGESYTESVSNARRIYPHLNDTGGFFVAALEVTG